MSDAIAQLVGNEKRREAERLTPDCELCGDTGNSPNDWEHPGFDVLGCPRCSEPDGIRCCTAEPRPFQELLRAGMCRNCGHPIRLVEQPVLAS